MASEPRSTGESPARDPELPSDRRRCCANTVKPATFLISALFSLALAVRAFLLLALSPPVRVAPPVLTITDLRMKPITRPSFVVTIDGRI